ncbi:MAG: tRNA-binding protein [archaeon]
MSEINYNDFQKVEIRVGRIIKVEEFLEARNPAFKLEIDFGELGIKKSSAQITDLYSKENLMGKLVVCVTNFPKKQIANFFSEVLTLGFVQKDNSVVLISPDKEVELGLRLC